MASLISAAQKDVVLDYLIETVELGDWWAVFNTNGLCGFSPNQTKAIITHFIARGLLEEQDGSMNDYRFIMKVNAHDFKPRL
jgi:hypothetical protein